MANFPSPFGGGGEDELFDDYDGFVPEHVPDPGPFLEGHDVLVGDAHAAFHRLTRALFEERGVYDMTFNYNLARLNLDTRHEGAGYRYAVERSSTSPGSPARQDSEARRASGSRPEADDAVEHGSTSPRSQAREDAVEQSSTSPPSHAQEDAGGRGASAEPSVADAPEDAEEAGDASVLRAEFTPTTPFCPQTHTLTRGSFRAWNAERDRHEYDLVKVRAAPMHHQSEEINAQLAELEEEFRETGDVTAVATDSPDVGSTPMERSREEDEPSRGSGRSPF